MFAEAIISWAVYNRSSVDHSGVIEKPLRVGSGILDMQTASIRYAASTRSAIIMAHGALMIAAFGALVPLAAMLNRHEWLFGKGQVHFAVWILGGRGWFENLILVFEDSFGREALAFCVLCMTHWSRP